MISAVPCLSRARSRARQVRLRPLVLLATAAAAVASAEQPAFQSLVDYCVSSRWGYSCFRPSSGAFLDLSGGRLSAGLVRAPAPARPPMHDTRPTSAATGCNPLKVTFMLHAPLLLAVPQSAIGRTSARGILFAGGAVLAREILKDVRGLSSLRGADVAEYASGYGRTLPSATPGRSRRARHQQRQSTRREQRRQ